MEGTGHMRFFIFALLFTFFLTGGRPSFANNNPTPPISFYFDHDSIKNDQQIINHLPKFEKINADQLNFPPSEGTYWISVLLTNKNNFPADFIVEIDNLLTRPYFFVYQNDSLISVPQNIYDQHSHSIIMNIKGNDSTRIFIKVPTRGFTTIIPLKIHTLKQFTQHHSLHTALIGLVLGFMILVLILSALLWIFGRNKAWIYLFSFVLTSSIYHFLMEGLGYALNFDFDSLSHLFFAKAMMPLASGFLGLFLLEFLDIKKIFPIFYKKGKIAAVIIMATTLIYPLFPNYHSLLYNYTYVVIGGGILFSYLILHKVWGINKKITLILTTGVTLLLISLVLKIALDFGIVPLKPIFKNIPKIGYAGLLVSLIYALFERFRINNQELTRLNIKLDELVKERTAEINNQNEELKTQAEELSSQREQLMLQKEELETQTEELRSQTEMLLAQKIELERLQLAVSNTDNLIYLFDSEGYLIWYNKAFSSYLQNNQNKNNQQKFHITEISTNSKIKTLFENCQKLGTSVTYESSIHEKPGVSRYFQTVLTPIFEENNLKYLIAIDSDITTIKTYELEIERQRNIAIERQEELELQQMEITDSLRYAQRIQNAILPKEKDIKNFFPNSFVIFKPRDIVSGDFYWFHRIENKYIFAAIDCTGHGVPGAFMSIIGTYLLNNIIIQNRETQPTEILKQLNRKLKISLKNDNVAEQTNDGMDIALVALNLGTLKLNFAGAMRQMFLVTQNDFIEVKGDKIPITSEIAGNTMAKYNDWEFDIAPGDRFYLFSDGMIDQFGGPENKKFLTKRFKQMLLDSQSYHMDEQKKMINQTIQDWIGNNPQVDDILILGVEI